MTRRKQTQPVQRRNSEGEESVCPAEDEALLDKTPQVGELPADDIEEPMAIERGVRSTLVSATDVDVADDGTCPSQLNDTPSSRRHNNDENENSAPTVNDFKVEHRRQSNKSDKILDVQLKVERSPTPDADDCKPPEVMADSDDVKTSFVDSVGSWKRSPERASSANTAAIGSLVDEYSSLIPDDVILASGRSSSVAQLESFVASVAAVESKPPLMGAATGSSSQPMMPPLMPLVSAMQTVQSAGGGTSTQSSSRHHHHSKTSKSKSITPSVFGGGGHALKSSGSRSATKSGSSSSGSTLVPQIPTSMFSAMGLLAPIIPFQSSAGAGPVSVASSAATSQSATSSVDQPLDLSTKSSRNETKYLSLEGPSSATTAVAAGQGSSSLFNLERQFGKGSAIFDRIGTKAWASPYCAAAMRFGMAAYSGSPSGLSALSPHLSMPPPTAPPPSSSHSAGSSSSKLMTSGGRSTSDDTMHRTPSRRAGHGDASSLLPWTQPLVSTDHKKQSVGAAGNTSTTTSSKSATNQHHHVHTNFRCSCGTTTETLYDLTLHIQKTGHSPAPPNSMTTQSALDAEAATSASATSGTGSSTVSTGGGASGSRSASSSKPYEYSKLVRGQDVWLSGGGERTRRSILRCIECGESFRSLPELTVHMVHTRHYTNIVGGGSSGGHSGGDVASTLSSAGASSLHHHHHHQQRKHGHQSGDRMAAAGITASSAFRSKVSSPLRSCNERSSPSTPIALTSAQRLVATSKSPPKSRDEASMASRAAIQSSGKELDNRKLLQTSASLSDADDDDIDEEADAFVRTPLKPAGGSSSYGGGSSRTPSPAGSTISTPTVGGKRSWSVMTRGELADPDDEHRDELNDDGRRADVGVGRDRGRDNCQNESGNESVSIRSIVDVEGQRNLEDRSGSSSRRNVVSPSAAPVDFRRRCSPDGVSSDKQKQTEDALSKPLSPTSGPMPSLSAIKAMESFIHSSFGRSDNRHSQTTILTPIPTTPRSTTSPLRGVGGSDGISRTKYLYAESVGTEDSPQLTTKKTRPSSTRFHTSNIGNIQEQVDDNTPTDLTMSSSKSSRQRGDSINSTSKPSSLDKKASPLTGTRDADSSTSMVGEFGGGFSGEEEDIADDARSTPEAQSKKFSAGGDKNKMHGKRSHTSIDAQHHAKHSKKEDPSRRHQQRPYHRHHRRHQHRNSPSDGNKLVEQERPTSSSSSFGRHSALESLQGLVYGQTLNTEHPLDSLQKLIYGGGGGAAVAAAGGGAPGTAAEVGMDSEHPVSSALGSGTGSLLSGIGSRSILHGHHSVSGTSPFGSGAFHTSLLGPQTLILVNPIVTVVSQASGGTNGSGSSLSITLPGQTSGSSLTQLCLSTSSKSSGSESSSSSAGSSPSEAGVHSSTVTAASEIGCRAADLSSTGRDSSSGRCPSPSQPRVYRCRGCRRKFSSKGSYRYHLSRCHVLTTSSPSPRGAASKSSMVTSEPPLNGGRIEAFHRPKSADIDGVQTSSSRPGQHSGSTPSTATYGGCVPLDGSARLQARYLPMDAAGAQ